MKPKRAAGEEGKAKTPSEKASNAGKGKGLGKNDYIVIGGLIVMIAIIAGFFIFFRYSKEKQAEVPVVSQVLENRTYHGFPFQKRDDGFWYVDYAIPNSTTLYELSFYFHPVDTLNVTTRKNIPYLFINVSRIYITLDPNLPPQAVIAGVEISKILGRVFGKDVKAGFTQDAGTSTPVITCENISYNQRVILLNITGRNAISERDGCVIVEGDSPNNLVLAADRLSFEFLRITEAGVLYSGGGPITVIRK